MQNPRHKSILVATPSCLDGGNVPIKVIRRSNTLGRPGKKTETAEQAKQRKEKQIREEQERKFQISQKTI